MRPRHVSRWLQGACIVMAIFLFGAWAQAQSQDSPRKICSSLRRSFNNWIGRCRN